MLYNHCQVLLNLIGQTRKAAVLSRPFLDLVLQFSSLDGKMTYHNLGKFRVQVVFLAVAAVIGYTPGRTLDKIQNGVLKRKTPNVRVVLVTFFSAFGCISTMFIAGFIEIGIGHKNEPLNANQNLQNGALGRFPSGTTPGTEQTKTNFATVVKVGIEADLTIARGKEFDFWRFLRVVVQVQIKDKAAVGIRSTFGT